MEDCGECSSIIILLYITVLCVCLFMRMCYIRLHFITNPQHGPYHSHVFRRLNLRWRFITQPTPLYIKPYVVSTCSEHEGIWDWASVCVTFTQSA